MQQSSSCFKLLMQTMFCAVDFAFESAGSNSAARMAMMAMTTSNSISVKPAAEKILHGERDKLRRDFSCNFA